MLEWSTMKGWARHYTFGLRKEWLDYYLQHWPGWEKGAPLGNRQVDSLKAWLKTAGLEDSGGRITPLGELFRQRGTDCILLWELLWVKMVFNFPTARWYAHLGVGSWTTTELKALLRLAILRLKERTFSSAINELAGLCERTPLGEKLGQGVVVYEGGKRRLFRRGFEPGEEAIILALMHLFHEEKRKKLFFESDLTWPWVVFGCRRESVLGRLLCIKQNLFYITENSITIIGDEGEKERWLNGNILNTLL